MAKRSGAFEITLPPQTSGTATYEWLYGGLRAQILEGRLRPGTRLPATREFARRYGLSRGTVVNAFELLKSEGYLRSTTGSGTFVNDVLPDDLMTIRSKHVERAAPTAARRHLSMYGARASYEPNFEANAMRAFRANLPAVDLFPMKRWSALAARRMRTASADLLVGCDPIGYGPLREAVAEYLNTWRGVKCAPEQILIVSGVQEAIDIAARVVLDQGDAVGVEDPGYPGARMVFAACGATIVHLPVDEEGLNVDERRMRGARLLFVTPGHQAPTGVTMSLRRRLTLLDWARRNSALIFEDDYDSEYRYSSRPLPALQGLDRENSVIFAGSFNKVLFPSLRLGYLVAPADLIARFEAVKSITSRHAQLMDQAVLCDFIIEGHFARHLRRMREIYAERLSVLLDAVKKRLAGVMEISDVEAGLQTAAWLRPGIDACAVERSAKARGVHVTAISRFACRPLAKDGLQLGFAAIGPEEIRRGVDELASVIEPLARD